MSMIIGLVVIAVAIALGASIMLIANKSVQNFQPDKYINFIDQQYKNTRMPIEKGYQAPANAPAAAAKIGTQEA